MSQVDPDSDIRERRFAGVKHAEIQGFAYSQKNTRSADAAFPSGALVHEVHQFHFEKNTKQIPRDNYQLSRGIEMWVLGFSGFANYLGGMNTEYCKSVQGGFGNLSAQPPLMLYNMSSNLPGWTGPWDRTTR